MAFSIFGFSWNRDRRDRKTNRRSDRRAKIGSETLEIREQLSLTVTGFPLPPVTDPDTIYRSLGTIVAGADGNLWFSQWYWNANDYGVESLSVGRMTPEGEFSEYPLPIQEVSDAPSVNITAGEDGNLWISTSTEGAAGQRSSIFRLTTDGVLTGFDLPDGYQVGSLAVTSRGTVWFAFRPTGSDETGGIGRMTPDGKFRLAKFKTKNDGSFEISNVAEDLTIGPNGALWFSGSRRVNDPYSYERIRFLGRTSPRGTTIRGYGKNDGFGSSKITTGPNRSIWFESNWQKPGQYFFPAYGIGKFNPKGEFYRSETLSNSAGVTSATDGNVWTMGRDSYFSYPLWTNQVINRVTPGGIVTVFPLHFLVDPELSYYDSGSITSGPADSIWWLTGANQYQIVQIGNLGTFSGSLDSRFTTDFETEDAYVTKFENITRQAHPRFAGTSPPGSVVTVYASPWVEGMTQADPDSPRIRLGAAHANRRTGVWQMKSGPALAEGKYLIYSGLGREPQSPELMYPLSQNTLSPDYELYGVSPLTVARQRPTANRKR